MSTFLKASVGNSNTLFQKTLLKAFSLKPVYRQFALQATITGVDSATFYRINDLEGYKDFSTLVDGQNPSSSDPDIDTVKISLAQYGAYIEYAASVADIQPVDLIAGFTKKIGKLGADIQEMIIQNELLTSTNIAYASAAADRANTIAAPAAADFYNLYTNLEEGGAEPITEIKPGSGNSNTYPVDACYIAIVTPAQAKTIKQLTGFEPRYKYGNPNIAYDMEIGSIGGIRILSANILTEGVVKGGGSGTTTGKRATSSHCDIHRAIVFGKEAFCAATGSKGIESIVKTPAQTGS